MEKLEGREEVEERVEEMDEKEKEEMVGEEMEKVENLFNNIEIETMMNDYTDVQFHMHLFSGSDELLLTKIDAVFDNSVYDPELIATNQYTTLELHSIGGALAVLPISYLFSFFAGELPRAYQDMITNRIDGPFGDGFYPLVLALAVSLLFALRPYFQHKLVYHADSFFFFTFNTFCYYFIMMAFIIFIDTEDNVPTTHGLAILISAFSYFLFYYGKTRAKRVRIVSGLLC
jgi:hypothetical protein